MAAAESAYKNQYKRGKMRRISASILLLQVAIVGNVFAQQSQQQHRPHARSPAPQQLARASSAHDALWWPPAAYEDEPMFAIGEDDEATQQANSVPAWSWRRLTSTTTTTTMSPTDENYYYAYEPQENEIRARDDSDEHYEYKKVIVQHAEPKHEMSMMYPVLLSMLILGALFVPFISLFFFLAVSAFNCHSGGGGGSFGPVTPIMGKRRKRRRRDINATYFGESNQEHDEIYWLHEDAFEAPLLASYAADAYAILRRQVAQSLVRLGAATARYGAT